MASQITVRLNKGDSTAWGFRLQGGKDFGTPLVIQKVNGGSPAERAGLIAGDSVVRINNVDVFNLLHKEAQDVIVRSGSNFDMVIQRGGSTWKPSVTPTGKIPKPAPAVSNISPVTQTSLAASRGENIGAIGTGHNLSAKPFSPQVNGAVNGNSPLINKQYNSPIKLYSEDAIAETLSAQTEVLSTGALGVNFKKNEKDYDATQSAVYRMLKEAEKDPESQSNDAEPESGIVTASNKGVAGLRHVVAPQTRPAPANPQLPPGQNICAECERLIVGVFVRIKEKNLHVECFKCATCGSSLKNVGYYNINNKLYCDIHAKSAAIAINNPAAIPITGPAGGKAPISAISAALSSHSLPSPSPLSPKLPTYAPSYPSSATSGPKPFSSVSAPLSPGGTFPRAAPLSPQTNFNRAPLSPSGPSFSSYSPASTPGRSTHITWPPPQDPDFPTASPLFYPPPSKIEAELEEKRAKNQSKFESEYFQEENYESEDVNMDETTSFYSEELSFTGRKSATECVEILSETLDTQKLVENVINSSPLLAPPSFNIEEKVEALKSSEISAVQACKETCTKEKCLESLEVCDLRRPTQYNPNTFQCQLPKIENTVPQKWESSLTQAVRTTPPDPDTFSRIPSRGAASPMRSALTIAPSQPFNPQIQNGIEPVPLPEQTEPYFPPEHPIIPVKKEEETKKMEKPPIPKPKSPFVKALEVAPDRPFTPVGGIAATPTPPKKKPKDALDKLLDELPKPSEKLDMRSALTTAPDRPYTPLLTESCGVDETKCKKESVSQTFDRSTLIKPLKPEELPESFKMNQQEPKPPSYYAPVVIEERIKSESKETQKSVQNKETTIIEKQTFQPAQITQQIITSDVQPNPGLYAPIFQGFTCSFKNKSDLSQFSVEVSTTPPVPTPPPKPQTPISYIATVEEHPARITTQKIVEEKSGTQQTNKRQESFRKEVTQQNVQKQDVHRQAEEVIQVKPLPVTSLLHKPDTLPSYQMDLKATAEADLILMEKRQKAQKRLEEQKRQQIEQQCMLQQKTEEEKQTQQTIEEQKSQLQISQQYAKQQKLEEQKRQQQICQQKVEEQKKQQQISLQYAAQQKLDEQKGQQQYAAQQKLEEQKRQQQISQQYAAQQKLEEQKRQHQVAQQHQISQQYAQQEKIDQQQLSQFKMQQQSYQEQQSEVCHTSHTAKLPPPKPERHTKPIITIESGDGGNIPPSGSFQPVSDKPPSTTFSTRPRSITPSMINKAPPLLPYYQDNLVSHFHPAVDSNILDPSTPEISRSPSPHPEMRSRSPSPFPGKPRQERAKSPAQGPPPNPLKSSKPLPTPQDSKIQQAKENVKSYLSGHKSQLDARGEYSASGCQSESCQVSQNVAYPVTSSVQTGKVQQHVDSCEKQRFEITDTQKKECQVSQINGGLSETNISEKLHQEQLAAQRQSQCQSVQKSSDGLTQIQRKKIVTEEYEKSHKETNIQIEKNVTTCTKHYPFAKVNASSSETGGGQIFHVTNPKHMPSFDSGDLLYSQHETQKMETQKTLQQASQKLSESCMSQPQCQLQSTSSSQPPQPPTRHVYAPGTLDPIKHVTAPCAGKPSFKNVTKPNVPTPNVGAGAGRQAGGISVAPKRGRGVLNTGSIGGGRIPLCGHCHGHVRGPFITALGKIWCPNHFTCTTPSCKRPLQDLGFVEEKGQLYCEYCFEQYLAPPCSKCSSKIKGDCLKAIGKNFHPECFTCFYCGKLFGNNAFFLEDGNPYCEADWNELFTTKCFACGFPVEAGDRWVEALNNNYHSQCFNCTMCKKNLEGQSFFAKGGRPFCKNHAR